jgi:hydroxyacylglutathione hydrolase
MKVIPVPCLKDNYAYLLVDEKTGDAGVVDPSEAPPIEGALKQAGARLIAILNTHHHWDHTGGNKPLLAAHPTLKVYGHASDRGRIEGQTEALQHGQEFALGSLHLRVLHNPGHTSGAVSYAVEDAVFTGDTMFAAGCGRLFEGTPEMMHASLCRVIGSLPRPTRVFFGHEYTENNLRFAAAVEPDNAAVQAKLARVLALRAAGGLTTPSTLEEEWATNPFMRHDSPTLRKQVKAADPANDLSPVAVLGAVRKMKDNFGVGSGQLSSASLKA